MALPGSDILNLFHVTIDVITLRSKCYEQDRSVGATERLIITLPGGRTGYVKGLGFFPDNTNGCACKMYIISSSFCHRISIGNDCIM